MSGLLPSRTRVYDNAAAFAADIPTFAVDPSWPKPLPNNWILGQVGGITVDSEGHIFGTGPGGIWVLGPDGEHLGTINTPEGVGNLAWGGPDYRTLFIGASSTLFRIETKVASHREPHM